jgi:hypothetical protein
VGTASTYTQNMAQEAATAYALAGGTIISGTCNSGGGLVMGTSNGSTCATWCYAGNCPGYV